jgi:hypothetical protein
MNNEKPTKKGFVSILKEAFSKSAGCCGAGETCGDPSKEAAVAQASESPKPRQTDKPVQK